MFSPVAIITSIIQSLTLIGFMLYLTGYYLPRKNIVYVHSAALVVISIVIVYFIQVYDNENIYLGALISFIQYFIIVKIISHAPAKNVMTAIVMAYIAQFLTQAPVLFFGMYLDHDFSFITPGLSTLLIIVCSTFFILLSIHFLPIKSLYRKILSIPEFVIFSIFFIFTLIGIMAFFSNEIQASVNVTLICFVVFLILTFALVTLFAVHSQKKEQAIHYYETYLLILDEMILNIRKTQHNHNNTIQSIASLPQSAPDYNTLACALERYSKYMAQDTMPTQFLHFENKLLAALLYNKYCLALEQDILLDIAIHNHFYDSKLTEFQIVDVCGILLDNAIEASHAGDVVYVEIGALIQKSSTERSSSFFITVKNPGPEATQDFIKKIFSDGYTSKAASSFSAERGLGLPYIKSVIQKHHGYIEVSNEMIAPDDAEKPFRYFIIHISV